MNLALYQELASKYGTPLYVYDGNIIEKQFQSLKSAFDVPQLRINYACKANTNINILRLLKHLGARLDVVSYQELQLGIHAGFKPSEILYTPNCVSFEEISAAVKSGAQINIDNIEMLEAFGQEFPNHPVCIRLNPHVMAGGNSNISVGHIDSKFGISIYQLPHVHRIVNAMDIKVNGLHMHTGSDIYDVEVFLHAADILFNAASEFENLDFLDFGSGFKVAYKSGDISTDVQELGESMSTRFREFCTTYGRDLELVFEPGKFLVSESGSFLVNVNVVKQTTSTIFAGVDSGFNHLIRPMLYQAHHDIVNISNPDGKNRIYTVVGYICETDTFGANRKLNEVRPGDTLLFKNAGAYCFSMASNYNSRYRPAEVLIWKDEHKLIRQRETLEDLLKNQVDSFNF